MIIKTFWCWICHKARKHEMVPNTEMGICQVCHAKNWAPQGDID